MDWPFRHEPFAYQIVTPEPRGSVKPKDEPFTDKIMFDQKALHLLKEFAGEVVARNSQVAPFSPPPSAINHYSGTPIYVDKTLKPGQWKAVDRHGKVLAEGNLLPRHLRAEHPTP